MQLENHLKLTAPKHFAGFLTAMDIPFFYFQGDFYIYRHTATYTMNSYLFRIFCQSHGVRTSDLEQMSIDTGDFEINLDSCAF